MLSGVYSFLHDSSISRWKRIKPRNSEPPTSALHLSMELIVINSIRLTIYLLNFGLFVLPGELSRIVKVVWTSDSMHVVLEIPDDSSKSTTDSQRCSWNQLFKEIEDQGVTEYSVNSHIVVPPSVAEGERSVFILTCSK